MHEPSRRLHRSQRYLFTATLILLVAASLRFYMVGHTGVTTDEALTYQRTLGSLQDRLEHIAGPGNHVPLYFLAVGLVPHETDLGLRFPGLMLGLVGIALMIRVTQGLYGDRRFALVIGLWVAVSPFMVLHARDARPYALVFVLSLLVSALFFRLLRGDRSLWIWLAFFVTSLAAYMTHYSAASLPMVQFIILLWTKTKPRFLAQWIAMQALAVIPNIIWLLAYATPRGEPNDWIKTPNIGRPYYTLTNITIGYEAIPIWYFVIALIPLTAGLGIAVKRIWQVGSRHPVNAYWLVLSFGPMLLLFLISQVRPLYVERYFMVAAPGFFLLIGLGWVYLGNRIPWGISAAIVVGVTLGVTLNELATTHFETQDWSDSTAYMLDHLQPGDGILLDGPHETAFWHYYRDKDPSRVINNETLNALYAGSTSLCELPYERLWLMTGDTLNAKVRNLFADTDYQLTRNYHEIGVRLVMLDEC